MKKPPKAPVTISYPSADELRNSHVYYGDTSSTLFLLVGPGSVGRVATWSSDENDATWATCIGSYSIDTPPEAILRALRSMESLLIAVVAATRRTREDAACDVMDAWREARRAGLT